LDLLDLLDPWTCGPVDPWTLNPSNLGSRYTSPFVRSTYIRVILLEAAIIIGLVILGRLFS
jgi:hypothetical protein